METEAEDENGDKTKMIRAHKMLLAGTSPVFKANFFGPMKMTGEVMVVRETTIEAFTTLIDFIYWPPGKAEFSLKHITCFEELCNIVEISERYQIMDLKQVAKEAIQDLEVTAKNVIIAASIADKYRAFEDIQQMLINKNLAYLERTMKSANDVISFMIETKNNFPENGVEMLVDLFKEKHKKHGNHHNIKGWETIIYSKPEEHKIEHNRLTKINNPCKQWRITHDFKPTSYTTELCYTLDFALHGSVVMDIGFTTTTTCINYRPPWPATTHSIPEVPTIGEWTTIDIVNEEQEPGKYILTVIFGGRQVFREEQAGTWDLNNAQVFYDHPSENDVQPGYIKNLSIMTK